MISTLVVPSVEWRFLIRAYDDRNSYPGTLRFNYPGCGATARVHGPDSCRCVDMEYKDHFKIKEVKEVHAKGNDIFELICKNGTNVKVRVVA